MKVTRRTVLMALSAACEAAWPSGTRADEQSALKALKALTALGAEIARDETRPGKPVVRVDLTSRKVKDSDLAHLKEIPSLEIVQLAFTPVTDAGLAHLSSLSNLQVLVLWQTGVTDRGLPHLKGLKKLATLNVNETKVTARGAAELKKSLPKLEVIR